MKAVFSNGYGFFLFCVYDLGISVIGSGVGVNEC